MPFSFLTPPRLSASEDEALRLQRYDAFIKAMHQEMAPVTQSVTSLQVELEKGQLALNVKVDRLADSQSMLATKAEMNELRTEVAKATANTYSREVMDLKFKERDDRLNDLVKDHALLSQSVGGLWTQAATKVIATLGFVLAVAELWPHLVGFFGGK